MNTDPHPQFVQISTCTAFFQGPYVFALDANGDVWRWSSWHGEWRRVPDKRGEKAANA